MCSFFFSLFRAHCETLFSLVSGSDCASYGVSETTLEEWFKLCREVCEESFHWSLQRGEQIGVEGVVVEMDESKNWETKIQSRASCQGWMGLGGNRLDRRKSFLCVVPDRSADTLVTLIKEYVAPGSIIDSHCWKGYDHLWREGFNHMTVNQCRIQEISDRCSDTWY